MNSRHAAIAAALMLATGPVSATAADPALVAVAESHLMIWNGVAIDHGRVFVSGPRWTGTQAPAVAVITGKDDLTPYPDAAWNDWRPGGDASHAFVDVNAIRLDDKGSLWVVDTGAPEFGGDPLPGGAKLVRIELASGKVSRVVPLGPSVALAGSYIDDVRFHGDFAYLTDAGRPGIIVANLATGAMRRVLENIPATTARADRAVVVAGQTVMAPDGKPLRINTDPMEVSPDSAWLYFGTLEGPWSRIATRWLDDFSAEPAVLVDKVEPWADLPPTGGTAIDANGDLYFSDLATNSLMRRAADGQIGGIVQDDRLHWVDALFIDEQHQIWLPVPQLDRAAPFHGGQSRIAWPVQLFRLALPKTP
jgi:sugar lactone lactonase YvrE